MKPILPDFDDLTPPLRPVPAVDTLRDIRCDVLAALATLSGRPDSLPANEVVRRLHGAEEALAALINANGGW